MNAWGIIYVATNILTGEQYVGQTKQRPHVRFRAHEISARDPKTKFHRAIAGLGYKNFKFEVIASAASREALNDTEKAIIRQYHPTYNSTVGGAGRARKVSQEERLRMSEAAKCRWANPVWRAKTTETMRELGAAGVFSDSGRKGGSTGAGARARWAGHIKTIKPTKDRSKSISASWANEEIRSRRVAGLVLANTRPEVRARRSLAMQGRTQSPETIAAIAKTKWKPVYCPELQITFLSRLAAAEYINVGKSTVSEALRHNRMVAGKYTLQEVRHRL